MPLSLERENKTTKIDPSKEKFHEYGSTAEALANELPNAITSKLSLLHFAKPGLRIRIPCSRGLCFDHPPLAA